MMGERMVTQENLFYEFSLEEHVPADHQLRLINRFVDLSDLRRHLAGFYSPIGRPSVDPELMIRTAPVREKQLDEQHLASPLAITPQCRPGRLHSPLRLRASAISAARRRRTRSWLRGQPPCQTRTACAM